MSRDVNDGLDAFGIPSMEEVAGMLSSEALRNTNAIAKLIATITSIHGYDVRTTTRLSVSDRWRWTSFSSACSCRRIP
jgi:hypothetical protein